VDLLLLAGLWGASFLFMRVSVPEFGAIPMMAVRVAIAGLLMLPVLFIKKQQSAMCQNAWPIAMVGILNSAIPFSLIAYSTIYVTAGFASILNASTPLFAALIGYFWLRQRLSTIAVAGLAIGFIGVVTLVWNKLGFYAGGEGIAVLAGLAGAGFYGLAANYTRKNLLGVNPLTLTVGSQLAATLVLTPFAIWLWPQQSPSMLAWFNVGVLALACTGLAQILYFRLIENAGAANATTVTFLIPVFGLFWGYLFLQESFQLNTLVGGLIILSGTAMITGKIKPVSAKVSKSEQAK